MESKPCPFGLRVCKMIRTAARTVGLIFLMLCFFSIGFHADSALSSKAQISIWLCVLVASTIVWWAYFVWTWKEWKGRDISYNRALDFLGISVILCIGCGVLTLSCAWFFQAFHGTRLHLAVSVCIVFLLFLLVFTIKHVREVKETDYTHVL